MKTVTITPPRLSAPVRASAALRAKAKPTPPAWRQAACYGRRDAGDLSALNPYPYGSQCWIIYEQARTAEAAKSAA